MDLNKLRRMAGIREQFGNEQLNEQEEISLTKDRHEITGDKNRKFILVTDPIGEELEGSPRDIVGDMISVVDGPSFANIFIGASMGRGGGENMGKMPNKENWTLYHFNDMKKALADANARLKKLKVAAVVSESFVDSLFEKATLDKEVLDVVKKALELTADDLEKEAEQESTRSQKAMYMKDASDYDAIHQMVRLGKHKEARRLYRKMDTAARDALFDLDFGKVSRKKKQMKRAVADYFDVELLRESSCGSENEEVKEVECRICGWHGEKDEYYDHMHGDHPEVVKGPYDEDEEGCGAVGGDEEEIEIRFENVRQPSDEEYEKAKKALADMNPKSKLGSIGVDNDTGDINIETLAGDEFILRKKTGKLELQNEGAMKLEEAAKKKAKKKVAKKKTAKKKDKAEDGTVTYNPSDVDESPESPMNDDKGKIKVPAEVKKALKDEIKDLRKSADEIPNEPHNRDDFYDDAANAMEEILKHLEKGNIEDFKKAQVFMAKLMGPITQRIPNVAYEFISGSSTSGIKLKDLFTEIKSKKK